MEGRVALYRPPTKVTTLEIPFLTLVQKADPDFERLKHREVEYVMAGGRVFRADPAIRGAYNDNPN